MQADSRPRAREAVNDANRCARGFRQVISERAIGRSCAQYLQRKRRNSQRHTSQGIPARAGSANRSAGRAREKVARQRAERCARNARIRSSRPACARHPRARAAVRIIYQSQKSRAVARDASYNIDDVRERQPRAATVCRHGSPLKALTRLSKQPWPHESRGRFARVECASLIAPWPAFRQTLGPQRAPYFTHALEAPMAG